MQTFFSRSSGLLCLLALLLSGMLGCNTIEGMGEDIKKTGEAIEEGAQ